MSRISALNPSLPLPPKNNSFSFHQEKKPDAAVSLLQICRNGKELLQIHALLVKTSLIHEKHAFGRLLTSFASLDDQGSLAYALKLFDNIGFDRNAFVYNTMIKAYGNSRAPAEAFVIYCRMCGEFVCPDEYTFTFLFSACAKLDSFSEGKQAHAQMVKCRSKIGSHSWNSLMGFYVKFGEVGSVVSRLFDKIEEPDIVSWNCLLDGYVKYGDLVEAKRVFDDMPQRDVVSWTIMLGGYVNAGLTSEAEDFFDSMPERNIVSWSTLIDGYVQLGCYSKALNVFKKMQHSKVGMDKVTLTTLLSVCANLGALDQGNWIYAYINKRGIEVDPHLSTALIDMYCKCGRIDTAVKVFQEAPDKKVFVWNAMLGGLTMHSMGLKVIDLFSKMLNSGVEPNEITFICVLAACNHSGLVKDGMRIFSSMMNSHNIRPSIEHYGCLVDLLSRSGMLQEALHLLKIMPMQADANILRALLGACKQHGNIEIGEEVGTKLIEMEPLNDANYVLLSNIYAENGRWEDVGKLRREMKARGLAKTPGCSSIELNGIVHEFVAKDQSHIHNRKINETLNMISRHMALQVKAVECNTHSI